MILGTKGFLFGSIIISIVLRRTGGMEAPHRCMMVHDIYSLSKYMGLLFLVF